MFKIILFLISFILFGMTIFAQENYKVYDAEGNASNLNKILEALKNTDVVFLGEQHNDAVAHALQLQIFKEAVEKYGNERKIILSLEMFERDVQIVLDEYLKNLISEQHFLRSSRPWDNYKTDYRPLVELAKEKNLQVIAANAPRRYVNMVSRMGRESLGKLSPEALKWLAPLPFEKASQAYADKFNALMGGSQHEGAAKILESQSLWDATMAYSIAGSLKQNKNPLIINLNGSFHTENRLGTVEHLLKYNRKVRVLVVTMRYEDDFKIFDKTKHGKLGDFVILTDAKVPRSFK